MVWTFFFCKEYQGNPATWIAINVENVDEYFELIKETGAKIISTPESPRMEYAGNARGMS
jgi:hypothetical protein